MPNSVLFFAPSFHWPIKSGTRALVLVGLLLVCYRANRWIIKLSSSYNSKGGLLVLLISLIVEPCLLLCILSCVCLAEREKKRKERREMTPSRFRLISLLSPVIKCPLLTFNPLHRGHK